ncbi:MAG: ABC transporter permease [Pseudorhodoferax sp.]
MRPLRAWGFALLLAGAGTGAAWAHAVRHEVSVGEAVVVLLRYTDGEPFAFERYELFRGQGQEPVQTGRTDGAGRLVLLPGAGGAAEGWRLRAYSADGHGIETALAFAAHDGVAPAAPGDAPAPPGWERVALGVCLILGLGLLGRHLLRRRPR